MKLHVLASGLAIGVTLLGSQQANAAQVTTSYVPFMYKASSPAGSTDPLTLSFENFASFGLPGTLKNVRYVLANDSLGNGNASATGQIRAVTDSPDPTTITSINYSMNLEFPNAVQITKAIQSDTNLTAVPASGTTNNPNGSVTIDAGLNRNIVLDAPFSGVSNSWGVSPGSQLNFFTSGTVQTNSYAGLFNGVATNPDTTFNAFSSSVAAADRGMLSGYIALIYDYDPPASAVPGPLPLLGAAAAFGWSRKIRRRISSQA
jgi:hypothetical protein